MTNPTTNAAAVSLHDCLAIPYRIEAHTTELAPGHWVRRASYPELPDCTAEAPTIEMALERLEQRRIAVIIALWKGGLAPPAPRRPLTDSDPEGLLRQFGFVAELALLRIPPR